MASQGQEIVIETSPPQSPQDTSQILDTSSGEELTESAENMIENESAPAKIVEARITRSKAKSGGTSTPVKQESDHGPSPAVGGRKRKAAQALETNDADETATVILSQDSSLEPLMDKKTNPVLPNVREMSRKENLFGFGDV